MVKQVERFPAELQLPGFAKRELLLKRQIERLQTGADNYVAWHVSESKIYRNRKYRLVEPLRWVLRTGIRIIGNVGPLRRREAVVRGVEEVFTVKGAPD